MFTRKNTLISVAVLALLAGCGGGGSDSSTTSNAGTAPTARTTNTTPTVDNSVMAGTLVLSADPSIEFGGEGKVYYEQFTNADGTLPNGVGPFVAGTSAPIPSFGLRVISDSLTAGQPKKTARFALDLTETTASAAAGETPEVLQLLIDQVDLTVTADAGGTSRLSVAIPTTAKLYVRAVSKAGRVANVNVGNLAGDLIRLTDEGDAGASSGFTLNLDAAIERAITVAQGDALTALNDVKNFSGVFDTKAVLSNVTMTYKGAPLPSQTVTVTSSNQPAVTGTGVAGKTQMNM